MSDKEKIEALESALSDARRLITGPVCGRCSDEMTLDADQSMYRCKCDGGCCCHINPPCSYCTESIMDAGEWWEVEIGDNREEARRGRAQEAKRKAESGPSAAARAKPVTRLIIHCQSSWYD